MKINAETIALVTGAASGLGAATARSLSKRGAKVILFDRDETAGAKMAEETGGRFYQTDVSSYKNIQDNLLKAQQDVGTPRLIVNCAGIVLGQRTVKKDKASGRFLAHPEDSFSKTIDVNLKGSYYVSTLAAALLSEEPAMNADGERGVIILTSSVAAEDGQIGQAAYGASKGGVKAMVLPMARDLSANGIRVMGILPGIFHTPMVDSFTDELKASLASQIPFPSRLGKPEEYAQLVAHIAENEMLNGTTIRLDGAVRMQPK